MHLADLHLDQSFSGIVTGDSRIKEIVLNANQKMFKNSITACLDNNVSFVLITGDTFHQPKISIRTQKFFMEQLRRLEEKEIKVILSFGNHDYYTENKYWFEWPKNVILFNKEQVETKKIVMKNGGKVAFSGFSYTGPWIEHSKLMEYPARGTDVDYQIGFYHGEIGSTGRYAPFQVNELPHDYDYFGLGHIHVSQEVTQRPLTLYPGTPQGHHRKEHQVNGIVCVELSNTKPTYSWLPVASIYYKNDEIILDAAENRQMIIDKLMTTILAMKHQKDLTVLSLKIRVSEQETAEILREDFDSLFSYLQDELVRQSDAEILLTDLKIELSAKKAFVMGFDSDLIDDLGHRFSEPSQFKLQGEDLFKNPLIAKYCEWDQSDIEKLLVNSSQLIKNEVDFGDEVRT